MFRLITGLMALFCLLMGGALLAAHTTVPGATHANDFLLTYGAWYSRAFDVPPEHAFFWWSNFLAFSFLYGIFTFVARYARSRDQTEKAVSKVAKHILNHTFEGVNARTLREQAEAVTEDFHSTERAHGDATQFLQELIDALDSVDQKLQPMDELMALVEQTQRSGEAARERLKKTRAAEPELNAALARLNQEFRPLLEESADIQLHLRDLQMIEAELSHLAESLGENGVEGCIERVKTVQRTVQALRGTSTILLTNPLGDNDPLEDVLRRLQREVEEISESDLESLVSKIGEIEQETQAAKTALGDPHILLMRIQRLNGSVQELQTLDNQVWYPLGDSEHLEDLLHSLGCAVEDIDQSNLESLVDDLLEIETDVDKVKAALRQAAARLEKQPSDAS